jgi:hypothetical protein
MKNENIIIISANPYDFVDEKGTRRQGLSIQFTTGEPMPPHRGLGWEITKTSGPLDMRASLRSVPGIYVAGWELKRGFDGKPDVKLDSLEFVGELVTPELVAGGPKNNGAAR